MPADQFPEPDDRRDRRGAGPPFPGTVLSAGVVWIGVGGLYVANGVFVLAGGAGNAGAAGQAAGGSLCPTLVGVAFLVCGIQTVKGTAADTKGNGVGSVLFGLLQIAVAVALAVFGMKLLGGRAGGANAGPDELAAVTAVIVGGMGVTLVAAGVLAVAGREQYREWRRANGPAAGRRGREDG